MPEAPEGEKETERERGEGRKTEKRGRMKKTRT